MFKLRWMLINTSEKYIIDHEVHELVRIIFKTGSGKFTGLMKLYFYLSIAA